MVLAVAWSRLPVGSSASMMEGLLTRARAMATRCFWPPERAEGRSCCLLVRPTSLMRESMWVWDVLLWDIWEGSSMFCRTVKCGMRWNS